MIDPANQPPAGGLKSFRRWAGGILDAIIESRRVEAERVLVRVLGTQSISMIERAYAVSAVTCDTPAQPRVERRGPNRATNVTRLHIKPRAEQHASARVAPRKIANAGIGNDEWEAS